MEARREQDDAVTGLDHPVDGHPKSDHVARGFAGEFDVERDDCLDELVVCVEPFVVPRLPEQFPVDVRDDAVQPTLCRVDADDEAVARRELEHDRSAPTARDAELTFDD